MRLNRLRWQLTLSHFVAIVVTLVSMVAAAVAIATVWSGYESGSARQPSQGALAIARSVDGMVGRGSDPADVDAVLRAIVEGRLRLLGAPGFYAPAWARWADTAGPSLGQLAYVVVVRADGSVLASSDPTGAAFAPPERAEWAPIVAAALARSTDPQQLSRERSGAGPAALGAAPIAGPNGVPVAAVVVAEAARPPPVEGGGILRGLAFFGVASFVVLSVSAVFALASAGVVAYWLSRRLVRRLERLGETVEALAAGDLGRRAEPGPADEVGDLARRVNEMADRLVATIAEVEARTAQAEGLLRSRRELVANVSHELRTPIATVRGYLESTLAHDDAAAHPRAGTRLRADLETVEHEVTRLQRLIDDLFTLSRAEVGRLELRLQPVDVGDVVRRLVGTVAPLAWQSRRVEVLAEIAERPPPARADRERLEQVVGNLLANAVRHTPPGGLVAVVVDADKEGVRVEVRDTGEGIAHDDLPRVFERFYRGSNGDRADGAGLGLALAKELVEAMDGSIEAASVPGEGSVFTVHLPVGTETKLRQP